MFLASVKLLSHFTSLSICQPECSLSCFLPLKSPCKIHSRLLCEKCFSAGLIQTINLDCGHTQRPLMVFESLPCHTPRDLSTNKAPSLNAQPEPVGNTPGSNQNGMYYRAVKVQAYSNTTAGKIRTNSTVLNGASSIASCLVRINSNFPQVSWYLGC